MDIKISGINYNGSFSDGPGVRVVVFLQGCNLHCDGCHNQSTWDKDCGTAFDVDELASILKLKVMNKKVTISGGEPFFQAEATMAFVKKLHGYGLDICLYTGSEFSEVECDFSSILQYLHYIKVGKYKKELRTTTTPYIGSTNQKFLRLENGEVL